MRTILLSLFILFSATIFAQSKESFFYRADGKLKADTNYQISKYRLKKWTAYEDSILNYFSKNIWYPAMESEAGIQNRLIVSFEIDDRGNISNLIHEGDTASNDFKSAKLFFKETSRVLLNLPINYLNGIKAPVGKTVKYYMPFHFMIIGNHSGRGTVLYESYLQIITGQECPVDSRVELIHTNILH